VERLASSEIREGSQWKGNIGMEAEHNELPVVSIYFSHTKMTHQSSLHFCINQSINHEILEWPKYLKHCWVLYRQCVDKMSDLPNVRRIWFSKQELLESSAEVSWLCKTYPFYLLSFVILLNVSVIFCQIFSTIFIIYLFADLNNVHSVNTFHHFRLLKISLWHCILFMDSKDSTFDVWW